MEDQDFPKIHVVDQWVVADDLICVQLVEIAQSRKEQLFGGQYGIGIRTVDSFGEKSVSLFMSLPAAGELIDAVKKAVTRHEDVSK
jgi:hypothetical protein